MNALHAGFVEPRGPHLDSILALNDIEIGIDLDGRSVARHRTDELRGGPVGSLRFLARALEEEGERLKAGDVVLSGSPGPLVRVHEGAVITVTCGGQRVELFLGGQP